MTAHLNYGSNLFTYDQRACVDQILITTKGVTSKVDYDEYVVYKRPRDLVRDSPSSDKNSDNDDAHEEDVAHRFSQDEASGAIMLSLAFRHGHLLDRNGEFGIPQESDPSAGLQGRIRRVYVMLLEVIHPRRFSFRRRETDPVGFCSICFRRKFSPDEPHGHLSMTPDDVAALGLHPATLQYATRVTSESRFWSRDRSKLSLIISFSETPKTPCDFLSLTYDLPTRSATILIRQSWEPRRHNLDDLDEYDHRLESCRRLWAHPLIMPVVLLQVQFVRCEEAVADNNSNVAAVENEVSGMAGFQRTDDPSTRLRRQLSNGRDISGWQNGQDGGGGGGNPTDSMTMTNLMKKAHEVLKDTIKLLDTLRWMERAVKLLMQVGDELADSVDTGPPTGRHPSGMLSPNVFVDNERQPTPSPTFPLPRVFVSGVETDRDHPLSTHWHEIRQYLDGLLRLCVSLETDRRMSEARCRAQIDIIYSKMAQEDNVLNARMAVASTRDSSSMKALAVITAVFLPGEFLGTLFGMSMFDFLAPAEEREAASGDAGGDDDDEHSGHLLSRLFWVYWATAIPLTLLILLAWRAWWVAQDRYFRRHLSQEMSEERFWTSDGKPRPLEHGFLYDLFRLSARRDEKPGSGNGGGGGVYASADSPIVGGAPGLYGAGNGSSRKDQWTMNLRQRQILSAREQSLQQRATAISV